MKEATVIIVQDVVAFQNLVLIVHQGIFRLIVKSAQKGLIAKLYQEIATIASGQFAFQTAFNVILDRQFVIVIRMRGVSSNLVHVKLVRKQLVDQNVLKWSVTARWEMKKQRSSMD